MYTKQTVSTFVESETGSIGQDKDLVSVPAAETCLRFIFKTDNSEVVLPRSYEGNLQPRLF